MSFGTRPANRRGLTSLGVVLAMVAALLPFTLAAPALAAASQPIAWDMVNTTSQNLTSHTNTWAGAFTSAYDGFEKYQRGVSGSIPFDLLDDSDGSYTADTQGVIPTADTHEFFGATDTDNDDNPNAGGAVSAEWVFDISGATDLSLSIDMGAMGDFEAATDSFDWSYSIDGGTAVAAFNSSVDEAGSHIYTMAGGATVDIADPLSTNGTMLTNVMQTLSVPISGTGSALTLTLDAATNGGYEAYVVRDIVIAGVAGTAPPTVYLSEIHYDNASTDTGEFVEVTGDAGTDLTGWSVEFYNGSNGTLYDTLALSGTIDDEAASMGALSFLNADLQNGAPDGFALINDLDEVIEFLSYEGSFAATDGTAVGVTSTDIGVSETSSTPIGQSLQLVEGVWIGPADESPGDLNTAVVPPFLCADPATLISAVQGSGDASPLADTVVEVEGIVVGDFQDYAGGPTDGPLLGFMLQEEDADADADPATSEGVFVYDPGGTDVAVGDLVRVKGTAKEYYDLTEIGSVTDLLVCSSGNPIPTPAALTLPTSLGDPVVDWEAVEGMGVIIAQPLYVTELYRHGRFGEIKLSAIGAQDHPNQVAPVGSQAAADIHQLNLDSRVTLDDGEEENEGYGNDTWNPATTPYLSSVDGTIRSGDMLPSLAGVVHYAFSEFEVHPVNVADPTAPSALIEFVRANARPDVPDVGGTFKVAAFNVLNYFTTLDSRGADTTEEFTRQADKIVEAIIALDADVVGLMEIENNGATAMGDLVNKLNAAPGATRTYGYIDTGVVGSDAITVAIIYDTATAAPVGDYAILDDSVSPAFLEAKNRPAVAQTFQEIGSTGMVTVAVNHLKSKGSDCDGLANPGDPAYGVAPYADDPDTGVMAGNCNLTRTAAAQILGQWLDTVAAASGSPYSLIIGDLNAYRYEDPITTLEALGYTDLHDVYSHGSGWLTGGHTYVYDGEHGSLDYAMASAATMPVVTGAAAWHINADEPPALDYNDHNPAANYTADEYRASDHDPVIVGLSMTPRAMKESTIDDLTPLIYLGTHPDERRIKRAIRDINRSLIESRWTSDSTLDSHSGIIVFWRERRAVRRLINLSPGLAAAGLDAAKTLVAADRELARVAIDSHMAKAGPLTRAEKWLERGDEAVIAEQWVYAVQCYMMAWVNATL